MWCRIQRKCNCKTTKWNNLLSSQMLSDSKNDGNPAVWKHLYLFTTIWNYLLQINEHTAIQTKIMAMSIMNNWKKDNKMYYFTQECIIHFRWDQSMHKDIPFFSRCKHFMLYWYLLSACTNLFQYMLRPGKWFCTYIAVTHLNAD